MEVKREFLDDLAEQVRHLLFTALLNSTDIDRVYVRIATSRAAIVCSAALGDELLKRGVKLT